MKILFVARTYHDSDGYLIKNKNLFKNKNYQEIIKEVCNWSCSWFSEFYLLLKQKGNIKVEIVFPNLTYTMSEILENKIQYDEYYDYLINDFNPDLLIFSAENNDLCEKLKRKNNQFVLWKSSKCNTNDIRNQKEYFDIIFSDNKFILNIADKLKIKNFFMLPAIPQRVISKLNFMDKKNDFLFTGSLGFDFKLRKKIIKYLLKNNINLEIRSRDIKEDNRIIEFIIRKFSNINFIYSQRSIIKKKSKKPYYFLELFNYMENFRYIINTHSDFDADNAINNRVFESLSSGCLLFTNKNKTLEKYFLDEKHLIVYKNKSDLLSKINFYKNNLELSSKIAQNGQELIEKNHTAEIRLNYFKKIININ